jgi:hypothetical protein
MEFPSAQADQVQLSTLGFFCYHTAVFKAGLRAAFRRTRMVMWDKVES